MFRGLCVVFGALAGAVMAELSLSVYDPPALQTKLILVSLTDQTSYHCYSSNPNGEFRALPNLSRGNWQVFNYQMPMQAVPLDRLKKTPNCVEIRQSSQRLRDREYSPSPQPETLRVLGIGDSFAIGEGVPVERSLFKQIERMLGKDTEVVNAGFSGYDTSDEITVLKEYAAYLNCKRAIVVFIANDIRLTPKLEVRQQYIFDLINIRDEGLFLHQRQSWYGRSRLLRLASAPFVLKRIEGHTIAWYLDSYDAKHNAGNLKQLADDLLRLSRIPNCRVAFVMYPLMCGLENGYPLQPVHETVGRMARAAGLPVLDLAPIFRGKRTSEMQVHPTDHHPNGKAHHLAAKTIVAWLRSDVRGFLEKGDSPDESDRGN